ncbi:MAG: hypothetical protein ACREIP_22175 [Alphaproteobacteria bacterium]
MSASTKTTLKFLAAGLIAAIIVMTADKTLAQVIEVILHGA